MVRVLHGEHMDAEGKSPALLERLYSIGERQPIGYDDTGATRPPNDVSRTRNVAPRARNMDPDLVVDKDAAWRW